MTDIEGFLTIYGHSDNLLNNKYIYIYIYITDDEQINCRFDLAFCYYLVSFYTTCVQHSSDKIAKYKFTSLH